MVTLVDCFFFVDLTSFDVLLLVVLLDLEVHVFLRNRGHAGQFWRSKWINARAEARTERMDIHCCRVGGPLGGRVGIVARYWGS